MLKINPSDCSLWEYAALAIGWREANSTEEDGATDAPPMTSNDYQALLQEIG